MEEDTKRTVKKVVAGVGEVGLVVGGFIVAVVQAPFKVHSHAVASAVKNGCKKLEEWSEK